MSIAPVSSGPRCGGAAWGWPRFHRRRGWKAGLAQDGVRWGPRLIDLDLLFYDDLVISCDELAIPHPLLHKREFVLLPLAEIAAEFVHPVLKATIKQLAGNLGKVNLQ